MKTIAIVAGKPSVVEAVLSTIVPDHDDHRILVVPYWHWGVFRRMEMPRGLRIADLPYVGTPHWRHWVRPGMDTAYELRQNVRISLDMSPFEAIASADETICVVDPCPEEAHSAAMLISHASGRSMIGDEYASFERIGDPGILEPLPFPELRYLPIEDLHLKPVQRSWNRGLTTHSPEFVDLVRRQCCIRFFNAAFQVNSMMILDPVLRRLNPAYEGGLISKSSLQVLYVIAEEKGLSMSSLFRRMEQWKGTGRHPDVGVGDMATRHQIVENLVNAGLVKVENGLHRTNRVGDAFVAALHKDCRDTDQFARLDAWARQWPASRPAVEKYLRTFFGKQKRMNGRSNA